ncbi:MAG: amidohydrolase family protein [bacterium]|nr:amidohydrolase family protein [bacterium]
MKLLKSSKIFDGESFIEGYSILVNNGIIEDLVSKEDEPYISQIAEVIDFGDATVVPGFIDTHTHMLNYGINQETSIEKFETFEDIAEFIKGFISQNNLPYYIFTDFDESRWKDVKTPTRSDLDKISEKPIFLRRICGHMGVGNTSFIRLLSERVDLNAVKYDAETGIFLEEIPLKIHSIFPYSEDFQEQALLKAQDVFLKNGITTIHEIGTYRELRLLQKLRRNGKLKIRVRFYISDTTPYNFEFTGIESGLGDQLLKFQGLKYFADGSVGGESALFSFPYGKRKSQGLWLLKDNIEEEFKKALELNLQIAIHAIGNLAIKRTLSIIEEIGCGESFRIEHFEFPEDEDIEKAKNLKVKISVQPNFIYNWGREKGMYESKLGKFFLKNNPLKKFIKADLEFAFGSDAMPPSPITGIKGATLHPLCDERLTTEEALKYYTKKGAALTQEESQLGEIKRGCLADFVIVDNNLEEIKATIGNGEILSRG